MLLSSPLGIDIYDCLISIWFFIRTRFKRKLSVSGQHLERDGQNILILVPHFDDEILGAYFFLQQESPRNRIDLLYITDGSNCQTNQFYPDIQYSRKQESLMALRGLILGSIKYLSLKDGSLENYTGVLDSSLLIEIKTQNYNLVLSPAPNDRTPDHHVLALSAVKATEGNENCRLLFYRSTWQTFPLNMSKYLYTGDLKEKSKAIRFFRSQRNIPLLNTLLFSTNEWKGAAPAEGFIDYTSWKKVAPQHVVTNMLRFK